MRNICVVGGGTAGWIAAGYFAAKKFNVTLIESQDTGIVGVGESTVPAINWLAGELGMSEEEWMPLANATYKLGIKHENWRKNKDPWWHWFLYDRKKHHTQMQHIENKTLPPFDLLEYGYHIDAYKFGETICKQSALKNNCNHIIDHITDVVANGDRIISLTTKTGKTITADFFIDCSGFRKLLASKIGMSYKSYPELLNNSAVACSVNGLDTSERVTTTKARSAGWIWHIPLQNRHGCGYVYSDKFITKEQAIDEFIDEYPSVKKENIRHFKFTPEVCTESIKGNVAVAGLSGGFVEPLEGTSVFLSFFMVRQAYKYVTGERSAKVLNRNAVRIFDETKNFVLCHYTLSDRDDTEYWKYYNNLEQDIKTKDYAIEKSQRSDYGKWVEGRLFSEYSWYSLADYFV